MLAGYCRRKPSRMAEKFSTLASAPVEPSMSAAWRSCRGEHRPIRGRSRLGQLVDAFQGCRVAVGCGCFQFAEPGVEGVHAGDERAVRFAVDGFRPGLASAFDGTFQVGYLVAKGVDVLPQGLDGGELLHFQELQLLGVLALAGEGEKEKGYRPGTPVQSTWGSFNVGLFPR